MALFKISKGASAHLKTNKPYANEGNAYFTVDDGKFYIDIAGNGTSATPAIMPSDNGATAINVNRVPLNANRADTASYADAAEFVSHSLTFGEKTFDGSINQEITAADLHIVEALSFLGTTNTAIDTIARKNNPVVYIPIIPTERTAKNGSVVIYNNKQYYWDGEVNGGEWVLLSEGDASSYKMVQQPIADGNALTGAATTTFISSITQDSNGNISPTKSPLNTSGTWTGTATTATNLAAAGTWTWTNGTANGPTASLTVGGKTTNVGAIPAASASQSGIITTGAQTLAGNKTFNNHLYLSGISDTIATTTSKIIFGNSSTAFADITCNVAGLIGFESNGKAIGFSGLDNSLRPVSNTTASLGTSTYKWANVYATTFHGALQGNADTATKLATARNIALTGSVTGNANFDGSGNITIATTTNHTHKNIKAIGTGYTSSDDVWTASNTELGNSAGLTLATGTTALTPANNDGIILTAHYSANYGFQIWGDDGSGQGGLMIRHRTSSSFNPWRTIVTAGNDATRTAGSATLPVYIGANGQATAINTTGVGISITGSSGSCTGNAATATTATNLAAAGTWTWTNGTTAGPTASLVIGGKTTNIAAVPTASASQSGAITTGAQTFAGAKTFNENIKTVKDVEIGNGAVTLHYNSTTKSLDFNFA